MKKNTGHSYRKRLTQVIDYIYHHLDGNLDVNTLAEVAAMSPYHFHRIYRQMAGETINVTIRRLRLQFAAAQLIQSELSYSAIATEVAYGSVEAFNRAFTKQFGEPPGEYRKNKKMPKPSLQPYVAMLPENTMEFDKMYNVEIMDINEALFVGYEHVGSYMNIGNAFGKLYMYAGNHGLLDESSRSIGLYYSDPNSIPAEELRSMACVSVEPSFADDDSNAPVQTSIPSGKYATILFKGSYAELRKAYDWFFGHWLEKSEQELADFPPFEEYLNNPKITPPSELLTRLHFKLA